MRSDQPQAPEARVALAADHQVVVDGNAERLVRRLDLARHLDVVARRLGIARGMVVQKANADLWHCSRWIFHVVGSDRGRAWGRLFVAIRDYPAVITFALAA